jgi:hypothetical protein
MRAHRAVVRSFVVRGVLFWRIPPVRGPLPVVTRIRMHSVAYTLGLWDRGSALFTNFC